MSVYFAKPIGPHVCEKATMPHSVGASILAPIMLAGFAPCAATRGAIRTPGAIEC